MVAIAGPGRVPIRPPFGAGTPVSPPARVLPDQPPPARLVPARLASTEGDGTGWRWPLPAPGTVARAFQAPEHPYGPGHRGVDLSSVPGGRVEAARDGVVGFAGWIGDRWVVTVVHGSLRTTYEPVRPLVREGEPIAGGQPIGLLESGHPGC
ncbi:M23 family metallopeptidase, partial [Frankia sp. EI5c]|uniref:M23 family metallopeptidase n=1 Tax=Frankia sp. EI5c TaxID=683316 RepID=UPI001F5B42CB